MSSITSTLRKATGFVSRNRFSALSLVAGAFLGVMSASLTRDVGVNVLDRSARWELPQDRVAQLTSDIDTMLAEPLFGGEPVITQDMIAAEDSSTSSEEPVGDEWRFIGIVTEGRTKHVVIFNETAGKTEFAQLGETLPGGEELLTIRQNDIEILDTNERRWLSLFVDTSAKEEE